MKDNKLVSALSGLPICKNFKWWLIAPIVILVVAIIVVGALSSSMSFSDAVNIGIDFEGGTIITVRLGQEAIDNYDQHTTQIKDYLTSKNVTVSYIQLQKADDVQDTAISFRYKNIFDNDEQIAELNDEIRDYVNNTLYPDITDNVTYESIGASASRDLLSKSGIALAVSLALILIYIIIRFTPASGIAAVLALVHDVVMMFCLSVICRVQINQSFVAAIITIVAYSINNTIVIFDRCRENIKPLKGQKNIQYSSIGDLSIKENIRRSIFSTFTTMVTVIFLAIFGSDSIREFCVPIILGLLAGLYSANLLATPMWSRLSVAFDKIKEKHNADNTVSYEAKENEQDNSAEESTPAPKKEKVKSAPVYKYNKRNTTFKKK